MSCFVRLEFISLSGNAGLELGPLPYFARPRRTTFAARRYGFDPRGNHRVPAEEGGLEPIESLRPIVVADADERERRKLEAALRDAGFDVLGVATGEAALALARKLEPALFILEIPLGRLSGYE